MTKKDIITGQELFKLIDSNQDKLFSKFYLLHFEKLVVAATSYTSDIFAAEEIVQNIFLKIWESPFSLKEIKSVKSYLFKMVINAAINHINREKTIALHHQKLAEYITEEALQDIVEESELIVFLKSEIEKLPPQCQKVFKLSRFEGMKYREIAERLAISEKTVENHILLALKSLRESLIKPNAPPYVRRRSKTLLKSILF